MRHKITTVQIYFLHYILTLTITRPSNELTRNNNFAKYGMFYCVPIAIKPYVYCIGITIISHEMIDFYNPWWFGEIDPVIEEWDQLKIKWKPDILEKMQIIPFSLNFVTGPRQVGKTTALKLLINQLLEDKFDPWAIFYLSCDRLRDFNELSELIDDYLKSRKTKGVTHSVIFLDEVTFVKDWWRCVKDLIDRRLLKNDVIFVSGSATLSLLKQKEYFPGRRGNGQDFNLLPLDFAEYVRVLTNIPTANSKVRNVDKIRSLIDNHRISYGKLAELFDNYLLTGGFPHPIHEFNNGGRVTNKSYTVYLDWIINDFEKLGKNTSYLKEIVSSILESRTSPINWNGIAKATSINSPHTTKNYVDLLSNLFILNILPFRYPDGKLGHRKNKKIHISDPFLAECLGKWTSVDLIDADKVESCIASHFYRIADVFYWKSKTEIDIISEFNNKKVLGIEVKWSKRVRKTYRYASKNFEILVLQKRDIPIFMANYDWK